MLEDEIETQLNYTLQSSITRSLSTSRPLLTHLNADTTWLLSLPIPTPNPKTTSPLKNCSTPNNSHPGYIHILIDPWLSGPQSDVARFFSTQWHAVPSSVQSISEVEEVIDRINKSSSPQTPSTNATKEVNGIKGSGIDAVVISHEFTDHMHQDTLLEIASSVPVFATKKAAAAIRSWAHFERVHEIVNFAASSNAECQGMLGWLRIHRLAAEGDFLDYHSAVMITFPSSTGETAREAVIYTPHGITPEALGPVMDADGGISTLALLHGLHDVSLGSQLNLGAHNGLKAYMYLGSKYWIGTHDEVKRGGGIVSWFLKRTVVSLKEAVEKLSEEGVGDKVDEIKFVELGNGEGLVLE